MIVAGRDPVTGRFTERGGPGRRRGHKNYETVVREAAEAQAAQAKMKAERDATMREDLAQLPAR